MNLKPVKLRNSSQVYPSSSSYFLSFTGEVLRRVLSRVFLSVLFIPVAGLSSAQIKTYSAKDRRLTEGESSPRSPFMGYTELAERPTAQSLRSVAKCILWRAEFAVKDAWPLRLPISTMVNAAIYGWGKDQEIPLEGSNPSTPYFSSDHGSRWGNIKVRCKNSRSGKSSVNANCLAWLFPKGHFNAAYIEC